MIDAISVLYDAFSKLGRKKGEISSSWNGSREAICATGSVIGSPVPFELGEKIAKYIRKVRLDLLLVRPSWWVGTTFTLLHPQPDSGETPHFNKRS